MKPLQKAIDRFCYKHRRFGIHRLMLYLVAGTALVYIISRMDTTYTFISYLYLMPERVLRGEVWRLFTWLVIPTGGDNLILFAISLYFFYFVGSTLENTWGAGRFTAYYCFGAVLTVVYSFIAHYALRPYDGGSVVLALYTTPYYLNLSLFFAFATLFPDMQVLLFFIIPVKMKWLALLDAALFLYGIYGILKPGFVPYYLFALVPVVAVLNYLLIIGPPKIRLRKRPASQARRRPGVIIDRETIDKARAEKRYTHRCAVCGKTDVTNPEEEFRYCSRCGGYRCYCSEHINDHEHTDG
ncbi:MAG: rhomboid family intramembrane serine protease [Oscillospiraceae bacterium]|jgi:hypothetical protein|nr:rhomboid family intramembrane serine protease [Oscillospiraceae bacterium]